MTTAAAPYRRHSRAWRRNDSSPSLSEIELTTPRPWSCRSPASITDHFELSTMTGTAAMSGSEPRRRRKRVIAATPSSIASSMFTSSMTAPFWTWSRAISTASSSPSWTPPSARPASAINRANRRDPVTFVRSPTLTISPPGIGIESGSRPDRWVATPRASTTRGGTPATAAAIAAVCSGVDPQHDPAMLSRPARAHSPRAAAICSGVSSYPPSSLGRPAFGCDETATSASRDSSSTCSRSCRGPRAQFSPTSSGSAWRTLVQNASSVCPESVRPEASVIVPETISGSRKPRSSNTPATAKIAALALSVSKMVSISSRSAPPAISPRAASSYASTSSSNDTLRAAGSLTSGEREPVRLVGPIDPATNLGRPSAASASSAATRARRAAASLISYASSERP